MDNIWPFAEEELVIQIAGDGTSVGRLHVTKFRMVVITHSWHWDAGLNLNFFRGKASWQKFLPDTQK